MVELSERHKREAAIMALFKEEGNLSGNERIQTAMSLDKLTDMELDDLEGWIQYGQDHDIRMGLITSTMGHDIHGIVKFRDRPDEGFSPRTHGYAQHKKEVSHA